MAVLESARLTLHQYMLDDVPALHSILSDPLTMRFWPAPFTLDATRAWVERSIASYGARGFGRWAVVERAGGTLIGDCGIMLLEVAGRLEHDLGYIFHHAHWNQGYATEMAEAVKEYAVTHLGIRRLVANMPVDNVPSRRVAEKLGMRLEKVFNNARNRDLPTYLYAFEADSEPEREQSSLLAP